jgi:hypothetical protein
MDAAGRLQTQAAAANARRAVVLAALVMLA